MQKVAIIVLLIMLLSSLIVVGNQQQQSSNSPYQIIVNYPKQVYLGQSFTISFELATSLINSTNFQYITPGTKVVNVDGQKAYEGFGGYEMTDKVNITNSSKLIISFIGNIVGQFSNNPGIILYNANGSFVILIAWSGILYLNKLHGLFPALYGLPGFTAGNYTVVLENVNSSVFVSSIFINSAEYLINYNTGIPWNQISYAGVRLDTDTVLIKSFSVVSYVTSKYVIYVNGKEYSSGYSYKSVVTLRAFSPMYVNITFPQLNVYKVIEISPYGDIDIQFPTLQVSIIIVTLIVIALGAWRDLAKRKST